MQKLRTHTIDKNTERERKTILYKGVIFTHLIIFSANTEHALMIKKLQKHFKLNDSNCKAGLILDNENLLFYSDFEKMYNLNDDNLINGVYEL